MVLVLQLLVELLDIVHHNQVEQETHHLQVLLKEIMEDLVLPIVATVVVAEVLLQLELMEQQLLAFQG